MKIGLFVSSDHYESIPASKAKELEARVDDSIFMNSRYGFRNQLHSTDIEKMQKSGQEPLVLPAAVMLNFTNAEILGLLKKASDLAQNTEEYTEFLFKKNFGSGKTFGPPPGSIKIYSKSYICYFNGKDWRKLIL